jgi:hypothetical protein
MSRRVGTVVAMLALMFGVALPVGQVTASTDPGFRAPPRPSWSPRPARPSPIPEKVIMTGFDSITEDGGGDAYRDELGAMITVPYRFAVTALSGSRCTHWAPQMSELLVLHNPAVVLINCGTNDPTATLEDRELLGQSYRQIIEAIHTHNPNIYIIASKIQISRVDPEGSLSWLPDSEIRANEVIDFNVGYYIPAWPTVGLVDF